MDLDVWSAGSASCAEGISRDQEAVDASLGSVQAFLEQLLAVVVAGNYRSFPHENVVRSRQAGGPDFAPNPGAVLATAPRIRARTVQPILQRHVFVRASIVEQSVSRLQARGDYDTEGDSDATVASDGRADFLAAYGVRLIGMELKRATMTLRDGEHKDVNKLWKAVRQQAQSVITDMRASPRLGTLKPAAVGLLVLRIHKGVSRSP